MMYYIQCLASDGGPAGFKQSVLKKDGKVVEFFTEEEALREANRLNACLGWKSQTTLRYWVVRELPQYD